MFIQFNVFRFLNDFLLNIFSATNISSYPRCLLTSLGTYDLQISA